MFYLLCGSKVLPKDEAQRTVERMRQVGERMNEEAFKCKDMSSVLQLYNRAELRLNPMACFNAGLYCFFISMSEKDVKTDRAEQHWRLGYEILKKYDYSGWEKQCCIVKNVGDSLECKKRLFLFSFVMLLSFFFIFTQ